MIIVISGSNVIYVVDEGDEIVFIVAVALLAGTGIKKRVAPCGVTRGRYMFRLIIYLPKPGLLSFLLSLLVGNHVSNRRSDEE